jgi:hypothetical protein
MPAQDHPEEIAEVGGNSMFSPSQAQIHVDYRRAELINALAADRLVRSAGENLVASVAERPSITRRMFAHVSETLSHVGAEIAAAGRRPHHV